MHTRLLLSIAILGLAGCPEQSAQSPGGGLPGEGGMGGGPPQAGGEPAGGEGGQKPQVKGWTVDADAGVRISGMTTYAGTRKGTLRIDFLKAGQGRAMPSLEHSQVLDAPGPWEVVAPKDLGEVTVLAYIDLDENGPSPGEPKAASTQPVQVGQTPVTGVNLELLDDWDSRMGPPQGNPPGAVPGGAPTGAPAAGAGGPGAAPPPVGAPPTP